MTNEEQQDKGNSDSKTKWLVGFVIVPILIALIAIVPDLINAKDSTQDIPSKKISPSKKSTLGEGETLSSGKVCYDIYFGTDILDWRMPSLQVPFKGDCPVAENTKKTQGNKWTQTGFCDAYFNSKYLIINISKAKTYINGKATKAKNHYLEALGQPTDIEIHGEYNIYEDDHPWKALRTGC